MSRSIVIILMACFVVACSGGSGEGSPDASLSGSDSPEAAVTNLLSDLKDGEFSAAVPLAIPGQSALASLAEGATVEDVAFAFREGDELITNNFWSGFAQTVESFLLESPDVVGTTNSEAEGVAFDIVHVRSSGDLERTFTTRDVDGYRIDIFATFGPSLASRLYSPVERLFTSTDPDAAFVLGAMREQVPSLHMAALTPGLAPNVVQDILQLIELITRVN
jgi:hypothetical protein